jgi:integrase
MATAPLFSEYARSFEQQVLPMKKPATIATMQSHLRFFCQPDVFGDISITALDRPTIQTVFARLHTSLAPKTLRNRWSTLHLVLEQAHVDGLLAVVPSPTLPRNHRKPQPFFNLQQMRDIIRCASEPYATFAAVLAETGARVGEVIGVREMDIDFGSRTLCIAQDIYRGREDSTKTTSADRTLSLSSFVAEKLRRHIERPGRVSKYVFQTRSGKPFWPHEAQKPLSQVMDDLKIAPAAFHAWRRGNITYAGTVLGMPEPILAERVGHRLPGMTFGIYTQSMPGYDKEWAERLGCALFGEA